MTSLGLNPVTNIIALPFALVVSVIAATTVFRNVFVAYDGFENNVTSSGQHGTDTSNVGNGRGAVRSFGRSRSSTASSHRLIRESRMIMDGYKSQDFGTISVHRVVDVNVDPLPTSVTKNRVEPHDNGIIDTMPRAI